MGARHGKIAPGTRAVVLSLSSIAITLCPSLSGAPVKPEGGTAAPQGAVSHPGDLRQPAAKSELLGPAAFGLLSCQIFFLFHLSPFASAFGSPNTEE